MQNSDLVKIPVQARSQRSTDRMLDAALAILDEKGLKGLTIAAVGRRAGVSTGAIYHRFKDRSALLIAAQERFLANLEEQWVNTPAATHEPIDNHRYLRRIIDDINTTFAKHRKAFRAFMITGHDDPHLRRNGTASNRRFAAFLSGIFVERFGCTAEAADSAFRLMFSDAVLNAMFTSREVSRRPTPSNVRIEHMTVAALAILTTPPERIQRN